MIYEIFFLFSLNELMTTSDQFRPRHMLAGFIQLSSMCSSIAPSLKKRSLMTIQNRVKRSFFTTQMDAVEL